MAVTLLWPADALGEVMDKEWSLWTPWTVCGAFQALAILATRLKPWVPIIVWVFAAFWAFGILGELLNPGGGPAILREAGRGYVVQAWFTIVLSALGPLAVAVWSLWRMRTTRR